MNAKNLKESGVHSASPSYNLKPNDVSPGLGFRKVYSLWNTETMMLSARDQIT